MPHIVTLLEEFYAKAGEIYRIPFDRDSTLETVRHVVRTGLCVVGKASCAGALIRPFPYNRHAAVALVEFWYFRTPREAAILDLLRVVCAAAGAVLVNVSGLMPDNRVGRFYEKRGYWPVEVQYLGLARWSKRCKRAP